MKYIKLLSFILMSLIVFVSCNKDDDDAQELEEMEEQIENFVTPEVLQTLQDFGFNFNEGTDATDFSGDFAFSTAILSATNVTGDNPVGSSTADIVVSFSGINTSQKTFEFTYTFVTESSGDILDTFYTVNGNKFSAYAKVIGSLEGSTFITLVATSGTITEEGIDNPQVTFIMLDDKGDPDNILIENGDGRLYIDQDGTASRQ